MTYASCRDWPRPNGRQHLETADAAEHEVVGFDRNESNVAELSSDGLVPATSLVDVAATLSAPRIFWVMLPAGEATEETVASRHELAEPGDIIIDGGNSFFRDDIRRSKLFARCRSPEDDAFADKLLSAMRFGFGGHGEISR